MKSRHFRRLSAWTSFGQLRVWHFACLTWLVRDFAISFAKSCLRRGKVLYAERLWIERLSCCRRLLKSYVKKAERTALLRSSTTATIRVGEVCIALCCGGDWICRKSESAPEYFGITSVKSLYLIEGLWIPIDPAGKVARTYPASSVSSQRPVKPIRCP